MRRKQHRRRYSRSFLACFACSCRGFCHWSNVKKLLKDKDKDKKDEHGGIGRQLPAQLFWKRWRKETISRWKRETYSDWYRICAYWCPAWLAVNPDMTALWSEKQAAIENATWRLNSLLMSCTVNWQAWFWCWPGQDEDWTCISSRAVSSLDSPCPSCGKHIVIRPKGYSVQDVNLKSGVSFLVRKLPSTGRKTG